MSRKPKKGYFVRGTFVAEGSELDLELKRELRGNEGPSKTELKRDSTELQALGEQLQDLRADRLAPLELPDKLVDALAHAKKITDFEGKRRQLQFVGKLMRKLDDDTIESVRAAVDAQRAPSAEETLALHRAEQWRDRLIDGDTAIGEWIARFPDTDAQALRTLVRQARKDAKPEKPGEAPRHGKSYREIFRIVKVQLHSNAQAGTETGADSAAATTLAESGTRT
ncbi:MAG: ribosome biogenesis factor YjgA [Burkholderiales bacterium]